LQRALPPLVLCATAGVALVLIFGALAPLCFESDYSLVGIAGLLYREAERGESLNRRDEAVCRCLDAKAQITAEVLAGRLTLLEAADAFHQWDVQTKGVGQAWDEEAVCRNVIAWVKRARYPDPRHQAAVVRRLEAELRQSLHSGIAGGSPSRPHPARHDGT
jgi:hypothetical protein